MSVAVECVLLHLAVRDRSCQNQEDGVLAGVVVGQEGGLLGIGLDARTGSEAAENKA